MSGLREIKIWKTSKRNHGISIYIIRENKITDDPEKVMRKEEAELMSMHRSMLPLIIE